MTSPKNAIVVGGSLGGLFTGIVLKRLGYAVTILERSPTPLLHDRGAGIVVGGETMAFIYHFEKTNRAMGIRSPVRHYLNRSGEEVHRQEYAQRMTSWDLMYYVLRANFDNVTSAYVQSADDPGDVKYEHGCTVTGIEEQGEQMVVTYDSIRESGPQKLSAPRIFAADGPSSTIRKLLLPGVERTYAGYVCPVEFAIDRVGCVAGDSPRISGLGTSERDFCREVYFLSCRRSPGLTPSSYHLTEDIGLYYSRGKRQCRRRKSVH